MARKNRIPKTIDRKLRDLDDHLYFLRDSLLKLSNGDGAYLKTLAVELRVLVCKVSGTEGLLWRVIDEVNLHDAVHVHLSGNLDRNHPLAKGLQFSFVRIFRAGQGDPRLTPAHYSLKRIIKECEALVVSGNGYTHENLIRAVAEQMGSAHEDEGVEPHLIELSGIVISDQTVLNTVLMSEADLILEVGERVLDEAEHKLYFKRKSRPEIAIPRQAVKSYADDHTTDFEGIASPLPSEGTVMFWVNHPHTDWKTNAHVYNFGLFKQGSLSIQTVKHSDKTMEVLVEGLAEDILLTRKPIPSSNQPRVMVGFTWNKGKVIFYLNGICVDTNEY
jgi:hypothetical protein